MAMLDEIREKIRQRQFELSKHAVDQSIVRCISVSEICEAINTCEVIEDYPDDKYGPSCLLLGLTLQKRPLHIQSSYPSRGIIKIITIYEPAPDSWLDNRIRRTGDERNND